MKNIFNSKNKKSIISAALAAISLFSFNFTPISVMSQRIASAEIYQAEETKVTENSSNTLTNNEIVSNLKDYFTDSSSSLNLSEYYESIYEDLILKYAGDYLIEKGLTSYLGSYSSLKDYYESTNTDYLDFIFDFITKISEYSAIENQADRLSSFYNDFARSNIVNSNIGEINTALADGISIDITVFDKSSAFYTTSQSYQEVKKFIDNKIKETIAIDSFDGKADNTVAAIIAENAPATSPYKHGSTYEISEIPYLNYASDTATFESNAPFYFQFIGNAYKKFNTLPYETNSNGTLVVYTLETNSSSEQATIDFLGYKTVSASDLYNENRDFIGENSYFPVPYSLTNKSYYEYLYKELQTNNKINETITFDDFVNFFYKEIASGIVDSTLYVKYSTKCYEYNIYATQEDFNALKNSDYAYNNYVNEIDLTKTSMKDYVSLDSISSLSKYNFENYDLYVKYQTIDYTEALVEYIDGFEQELVLDIKYEQTNNKNNIYVLDESENADENKIYQSLGFTVITEPTIDYVKIDSSDDNYNKNYNLYYKYKDTSNLFAKNFLVKDASGNAKNAVYVLSTSVESNITTVCKMNNYIPLSTDELNAGFFTKVNEGDDVYTDKYELYYKYDTSAIEDEYGFITSYNNAKYENKIYEYTSATSEYIGFYKTDANYKIEDYQKIDKSDVNFKQGFDLYYKKLTKTTNNPINQNVIYYYQSKNTITLNKNSYYAISFYVNTTGENISASVEFIDDNKILNDAKITGITTEGKWVKYYLFIATDLLTDSLIKTTLSMGTKDGISPSGNTLTGSVLFDEVVIYEINETDYHKQTINNKDVFVLDGEKQIDNEDNKNEVKITPSFSARTINDDALAGWNEIFDFDNIDNSHLSNSAEYGGNLQNIDIDNLDGYTEVTELWQYYISRDVSGKGNSELLNAYRQAYKDLKVQISLVSESDEKSPEVDDPADGEETDDENSDNQTQTTTDEDNSKVNSIISDTFNNNNNILKIANSSTSMSLGVISKPFTLKCSEYYKISLWIYSADEKSTATIKIISHSLTALNNEYGIEISAGSSDISAHLADDDEKTSNEYRWLPVEFYVQGDVLSDKEASLVLLADENSTVYFDNIKIEKITSTKYSDTSATTRVYKLALTNSSTVISKNVTNGFFNDSTVTDLTIESYMPKTAQNWTVTTDAVQDYVTAGIISSTNQQFIDEYNSGASINDLQIPNMYAVNIKDTPDIPVSTHKIYTAKTISLSSTFSVYKITFEYYYSNLDESTFKGDIISNLYNSSYKTENKISSIRVTATPENADKWNQITFYVATGSAASTTMLELGVENAAGTIFFRNVYATTISKTLDEIRIENSTLNGENLILDKDNINIVDFSNNSFTINNEADEDGLISSNEFTTTSSNTTKATTGKTGIIIASYFTNSEELEKTVTIDSTTYYVFDGELYKYPVYANTSLDNNEKVTDISQKTFEINGNKVVVGTGLNETEYEIVESKSYSITYSYENDATIGSTTISADELKNAQSNNVLIIANSNETDYTSLEGKYKMSLSSSSYYAVKVYVKTGEFEDNQGLSIKLSAKDLEISWNENLIDTTDVESELHKDSFGFVCYQALIATNKSSYSDLVVNLSIGSETNPCKGYAIISKVELVKLASEEEFDHYSALFANEEDDSIVKTFNGSESSTSNTESKLDTTSEVTWATFFYIFSSLLLFITIVIAMVAIIIKKHPIKHKVKGKDSENFDVSDAAKTKEKISEEKDTQAEGGIE